MTNIKRNTNNIRFNTTIQNHCRVSFGDRAASAYYNIVFRRFLLYTHRISKRNNTHDDIINNNISFNNFI